MIATRSKNFIIKENENAERIVASFCIFILLFSKQIVYQLFYKVNRVYWTKAVENSDKPFFNSSHSIIIENFSKLGIDKIKIM